MSAARRLGANALRVYLELFAFIRRKRGELEIRDRALAQLRWILAEAERQGIYLNLTGNLVWRRSRAWYDALSAGERWRVQARFWRAVARESAASPAVLAYELTSEPVVPASDPGSWYGGEFGGFNFTQYVVRELGGREPDEIARSWITRLSRAIRREDRRHLIGVGLLPFVSGPFGAANVADLLDILFLHDYPRTGGAAASLGRLQKFKSFGRPVIIGETFALNCGLGDYEEFLLGAREYADGYLTFFDGRAPEDVDIECGYDRAYLRNLTLFLDIAPQLIDRCPECRATVEGAAFARGTQRQRGSQVLIRVGIEAKEDLQARVVGGVRLGGGFELEPAAGRVPLGATRTLRLQLRSERENSQVVARLRSGETARADLRVKLTDRLGNTKREKLEVKLKR